MDFSLEGVNLGSKYNEPGFAIQLKQRLFVFCLYSEFKGKLLQTVLRYAIQLKRRGCLNEGLGRFSHSLQT